METEIRRLARSAGAAAVGIASADRLTGGVASMDPGYMLSRSSGRRRPARKEARLSQVGAVHLPAWPAGHGKEMIVATSSGDLTFFSGPKGLYYPL